METFPVRRNTVLLAATLTSLSGMVQLAVAVATVTLVLVTGIEGILGLGPAIFLTAGALAAFPAGRLMDRLGRVPVLAAGCVAGIAGCLITALGCELDSAAVVITGFALVGVAQGTILLARAAAADMYPPERRARGISYVLFGALFGAALGPLVFRPLFAGKELDTEALVVPWLAAAGIMVIGLVLVLNVRPDPKTIAQKLHFDAAARRRGLRPDARDRPPARRDDGARRRRRELRRDGLGDEPDRLPRHRPRPPPGRRVHGDQPPHRRHVRARARRSAS